MNHIRTKTTKRWWWWVALVFIVTVILIDMFSLVWTVNWVDSVEYKHVFTLSNSRFEYFNYDIKPQEHLSQDFTPWYEKFSIGYSFVNPKEDLPFFPHYTKVPGLTWVVIPLHILVFIPFTIVIFPMLPGYKKIQRRKHGLCLKCAYDLSGNESGTCPECGTEIQT